MKQADRIRQFALDHYVALARVGGRSEITIRAGDVHQAMGLANAMPAVCSAIGSNKFNELASVTPGARTGPANGANVYFQFHVAVNPSSGLSPTRQHEPLLRPAHSGPRSNFDLGDALVLVSCVKSKLAHAAPARALYEPSAWFRKVRGIVEASGSRWFVLSSRYGLVRPDDEIAPYDYTLNILGVAERQDWVTDVLRKLLPEVEMTGVKRVVMFAGDRYRGDLIAPLQGRGIKVEVPMEGLTRGEQLAWLSEHSPNVK
jgi:hypothetical protein